MVLMEGRMKNRMLVTVFSALGIMSLNACATTGDFADNLNPYSDGNKVSTEYGGERNTNALGGGSGAGKEADNARHALEVLGTYRKAQTPEPAYPVIQPAEVRLMWIPDHLNAVGDLVPAHYYYLRVLPDRPAVTDAFEIERQLDLTRSGSALSSSGNLGTSGDGESTPWVYKEVK